MARRGRPSKGPDGRTHGVSIKLNAHELENLRTRLALWRKVTGQPMTLADYIREQLRLGDRVGDDS